MSKIEAKEEIPVAYVTGSPEMVELPEDLWTERAPYFGRPLAICSNPDGRFHGWLFYKHPDGKWISLRKLVVENPT